MEHDIREAPGVVRFPFHDAFEVDKHPRPHKVVFRNGTIRSEQNRFNGRQLAREVFFCAYETFLVDTWMMFEKSNLLALVEWHIIAEALNVSYTASIVHV